MTPSWTARSHSTPHVSYVYVFPRLRLIPNNIGSCSYDPDLNASANLSLISCFMVSSWVCSDRVCLFSKHRLCRLGGFVRKYRRHPPLVSFAMGGAVHGLT